ncbi:hypothetical protein FV232_24740 [Methylobacterium sp. WL30]|uniref:hypothetical protein n=1 Tax=unclassified Methylobacterium TaxID=2615210 RepID=UPI0011CAA3AC|nr:MULTISPECIES: hypothetical protein [unclassified Methylobacterium]TXN41421.1 hypothetical protein FV225_02735 [Methylobacterium sp. WL93]TXN49803.1 hypothetical protein FV227_15025 [Methylobacterium sp. WL119]TXN62769.1 hypothetical protein FV232_24740 [Methylobacterium sp. WL30]
MRNPLNRHPSDETKPTLRERLTATKAGLRDATARAGKAAASARIMLQKPKPKPEPAPVERETNPARRAVMAGSLAAAVPLPALASAPSLSTEEAAFLAVLPAVLPLLHRIIPADAEMTRLYDEAEGIAGRWPGPNDDTACLAWSKRCDEARDANGYHAAWQAANAIEMELVALVEEFEKIPMQTLPAILLKVALNGLGEWWEESACADLHRLAAERFGLPVIERPEA